MIGPGVAPKEGREDSKNKIRDTSRFIGFSILLNSILGCNFLIRLLGVLSRVKLNTGSFFTIVFNLQVFEVAELDAVARVLI